VPASNTFRKTPGGIDRLSMPEWRPPAYAQHILARWLRDDVDYGKDRVRAYTALRDIVFDRLASANLLQGEPPRGTAFVFAGCMAEIPDQMLALTLKTQAGLVVNPRYQFGPHGRGHFRLSFAQKEEALRGALERIVSTVHSLAANT